MFAAMRRGAAGSGGQDYGPSNACLKKTVRYLPLPSFGHLGSLKPLT
jgi:hypothetical protein